MRDATPITLRLVYLARLREALGRDGEALEFSRRADAPCVGDVLDALRARGGAWAHELAAGRAFRVAVNHEMATASSPLRDGDEVAIFPPVTGG